MCAFLRLMCRTPSAEMSQRLRLVRVSRSVSVLNRTDDARRRGQDGALNILCARCGSERLIPLTFGDSDNGDRVSELPARPIMKCVECSELLYARNVVRADGDSQT